MRKEEILRHEGWHNTGALFPWRVGYSKSRKRKAPDPLVEAVEATDRIRSSAPQMQGPIQLVQNPHDCAPAHLFTVAVQMQLVGIGPVGVGLKAGLYTSTHHPDGQGKTDVDQSGRIVPVRARPGHTCSSHADDRVLMPRPGVEPGRTLGHLLGDAWMDCALGGQQVLVHLEDGSLGGDVIGDG